jgi:hypothetical protein
LVFAREQPVELPHHRGAHAVTDQDRLVDPRVPQHGVDPLGEHVHGVVQLGLVALAVTGQVDEQHPHLAVEPGRLVAPDAVIATPAVDEHDGRVAFPERLVMHLQAAGLGEPGRGLVEDVGRPVAAGPLHRQHQDGKDEPQGIAHDMPPAVNGGAKPRALTEVV